MEFEPLTRVRQIFNEAATRKEEHRDSSSD
jgi:hypothetical protein